MTEPLTAPADTHAGGPPSPDDLRGPLLRYRVLAYIVGVGLIVLVFVGIPMQIWAHNDLVAAVVGTAHGYLYMLYVVFAFLLARRAGWTIGRTLAVMLAGTVPGVSFVAERKVTRWVREGR
jgi:integral membrane protein